MQIKFDQTLEKLDEIYRKMEPVDQLLSLEFVDVMVQQWRLNAFGDSPSNDQGQVAMERGLSIDRVTTVI